MKLNGWPQRFDERIEAIAQSVDEVILIRPKPAQGPGKLGEIANLRTYDLRPARGRFVTPGWAKPLVYGLHVVQAILVMLYLYVRGELPPVVHALDYALGGMAGGVIATLCGVPFVVSVRGLKDARFNTIPVEDRTVRNRLSHRILQGMTRFVFSRADHIVTKADYQVAFVEATCDVDAEFTTLPTGVDFDRFDPNHDANRPWLPEAIRQRVDDDDDLVLYLSTLIPEKGPDQVLHLLGEIDDHLDDEVVFVFIGEFRDVPFEDEFRTLMQDLPGRVVLHPTPVRFEQVPGVLARADATVLLSEAKTEGVPRTLQESCTMGTPIVAADVAGIADAFEDLPGCYLIDRDEPREFEAAVTDATQRPAEMPRDVFADHFDMYRNYARYAEIYADLVAKQRS